ncbi:MAG: DUF4430 domain-containing protein [Patescibacteria group bacterium]
MKSGKFLKYLKYAGYLAIIAVVFLLGVSVGRDYGTPEADLLKNSRIAGQSAQTETASIMIDYGNGEVETHRDLPITATSSVFDVLKSAADANNLNLGFKDYGKSMGIFIESIGGVGEDPAGKKWWQYWVNNAYSQVGVSNYNVKHGDVIEFKFIQGQV